MMHSGSIKPRSRCWRLWNDTRWRHLSLGGCTRGGRGSVGDKDARALLDSVLGGQLDAQVSDQIVAETRGNPLALMELPRGLTPAQLAGGVGFAGPGPLGGRIH